MKTEVVKAIVVAMVWFQVDTANGVEFEKMSSAIGRALGSTKAFKTSAKVGKKSVEVYYSKDASGKARKFGVIQKAIYEPGCTHTWVIGIDAKTATLEQVRVVEMSCPHAFPAQKASYLEQYKGRGPASVTALKEEVHTVAKATGSCDLTTDAVVVAIEAAKSLKGRM